MQVSLKAGPAAPHGQAWLRLGGRDSRKRTVKEVDLNEMNHSKLLLRVAPFIDDGKRCVCFEKPLGQRWEHVTVCVGDGDLSEPARWQAQHLKPLPPMYVQSRAADGKQRGIVRSPRVILPVEINRAGRFLAVFYAHL